MSLQQPQVLVECAGDFIEQVRSHLVAGLRRRADAGARRLAERSDPVCELGEVRPAFKHIVRVAAEPRFRSNGSGSGSDPA